MRIGDRVLCTAQGWAAGKEVEIKGIIRDYRTIWDNAALDALGGIRETDQIIFSLVDADGFRYSSPDGRPADFEGVSRTGGFHNARLNVDSDESSVIH